MNFVFNCIKGIAIGAGAILPGISSGVLCVIFGIYEKLIDCALNFFKDFKNNLKFLFPILIGIAIGVILFGNILRYLFQNYLMQTCFCFIGIMFGGIPSLIKNANSKKGFRLSYLAYTIFTLIITLSLLYIEKSLTITSYENNNFLFLILSGFIMSIGVVVPGVSSTVLLMLLGIYDTYLLAISTVNLYVLFPMGLGLLIGGYIFLKLTKYLLENFYTQTYYGIIGFVLGSIPILYPGLSFNLDGFIAILCFIIGLYIPKIIKEEH